VSSNRKVSCVNGSANTKGFCRLAAPRGIALLAEITSFESAISPTNQTARPSILSLAFHLPFTRHGISSRNCSSAEEQMNANVSTLTKLEVSDKSMSAISPIGEGPKR
jgi:hypothetical protein